jgi:hypothetical protein
MGGNSLAVVEEITEVAVEALDRSYFWHGL